MLALTLENSIVKGLLETGVFTVISGTEVISKATIEVLTSCCSEVVLNTFEVDVAVVDTDNYTIADDEITLKAAAYLQTGDIQESLYTIRVALDVTVDGTLTTDYLSYTLCYLLDTELKCMIARVLLDDIYNTELVVIYNSILTAITCNDCCTACKLYTYLIDKLNECTNC
jgi:hypothetical protein